MFLHTWEVARVTLLRDGEFPLWNPYWCGGITLWGNPETQIFYPLFYLSLVIGSTAALKLYLVLHTAIGFSGMYMLARREYALEPLSAGFAAFVWSCSGTFARDGGGGHVTLLMFYWAPWVLLSWRLAIRDIRWSAATAGLMSLVALGGGTYPFPYLVLLLCFDGLVQAFQKTRPRAVLRAALVTAMGTALMSAIRIVPSVLTLFAYPRHYTQHSEHLSLREFVHTFIAHDMPAFWGKHEFGWWEYDAFIGWTALVLGLIGALFAWRSPSPRRHLVLGGLLFSTLALGHFGTLAPWSLLNQLPVFSSLRVPSRFLVWTLFYLSLLAGIGLHACSKLAQWIAKRIPHVTPSWVKAGIVCAILLCTLSALEILIVNIPKTAGTARAMPLVSAPAHPRFHYVTPHDYWYRFASFPQQNLAIFGCYSEYHWPIAHHLWMGDVPQARVPSQKGHVSRTFRAGNHAWADVTLIQPALVVFNHNFAPGWKSNLGPVLNHEGHAAVRAPKGAHRIYLKYRPKDMPWAIVASILGGILMLATAIYGGKPSAVR